MSNNIKMLTTNKDKIVACYNDFACYKASLELYYETILRQRELTNNVIDLITKKKILE